MAKKKKRVFIFKDEYMKAHRISIRNKSLGRLIRLSKEQVLSMAENGRLDQGQIASIFKPESETTTDPAE